MGFELWLISENTMTNITPIVGNIDWSSDINTLGQQLNFSSSANDDRFFPRNPIDVGNMIILKNKGEIFRGIVVEETRNGRYERTYTCLDPAFYLNQSRDIFQFNGEKANYAIEKMLKVYDVPIGNIVSIPVEIDKIFTNTISDNIKEILDTAHTQTGIKYRMEMRAGKLYIERQTDLVISGTFKLAYNLGDADIRASISNPNRTRSIENMKNQIKIISDDKVVATVKNDSLIDLYGLLTETHSIDATEIANARSIASNLLEELGKVFEEGSLQMLGDENVRAGRLINIEEPITGMTGQYLIKNVNHTLSNGIHMMTLSLEAT
ncbi:hypothetical protein QYF48_12210 [Brevibacillus agri]|uniref:XkdQ/YqbQ family protein n=1 Tax=Brevibacillus agri TaxID=51101 RepID=UPI0025B6A0BE|nr:hypothetical protein [Brevibacillus agri]MDN4093579.1 hypothetical protein [Brevibacillus agri]